MAIYLYRKKVEDLKHHVSDPANFSENLNQPEEDVSGEKIYHCQHHNHLPKCTIPCLCEGLIPGLDLQFLRDALHDRAQFCCIILFLLKTEIVIGLITNLESKELYLVEYQQTGLP